MTETVPGGYYIGTDGQPHDAWGRPIAPRPVTDSSGDNNILSDEEEGEVGDPVAEELNGVRAWYVDEDVAGPPWHELGGLELGERVVEALVDAGFVTLDDVHIATDAALLAVDGVGPATLRKIRHVLAVMDWEAR